MMNTMCYTQQYTLIDSVLIACQTVVCIMYIPEGLGWYLYLYNIQNNASANVWSSWCQQPSARLTCPDVPRSCLSHSSSRSQINLSVLPARVKLSTGQALVLICNPAFILPAKWSRLTDVQMFMLDPAGPPNICPTLRLPLRTRPA